MSTTQPKPRPRPKPKYYDPDRGPDRRRAIGRRAWSVAEIQDRHREIIRRKALGQKNVQIAKAMGISPQLVSNVVNSPLVKEQLAIIHGAMDADTVDLGKEIREIAPRALKVLENVMDDVSAPPALRVSSARDLLDRAGYAPVKRTQNVHALLTSDKINAIKQRALEAKGGVIDVEGVVVDEE